MISLTAVGFVNQQNQKKNIYILNPKKHDVGHKYGQANNRKKKKKKKTAKSQGVTVVVFHYCLHFKKHQNSLIWAKYSAKQTLNN